VSISSPADGEVVAAESVAVTGTVDDPTATVTINGIAVTVDNEGNFEVLSVPLNNEGSNIISAVAVNPAGQGQDWITVVRDTTAPDIILTSPQEGALFNTQSIDITGTIDDDPQAQITVNGVEASLDEQGVFRLSTFSLTEGENQLTIEVRDGAGNSSQIIVSVILDTTAPAIQITSPQSGELFSTTPIQVIGIVNDPSAMVKINQTQISLNPDNDSFSYSLPLTQGENTIAASAEDRAGNKAGHQVVVYLDTQAPEIILQSPQDGLLTSQTAVMVKGMVDDISAQVTISGVNVSLDTTGAFQISDYALTEGENEIIVMATDTSGNTSQAQAQVTRDTIPPSSPQLDSLPSVTNNHKITISGTTDPGAQVIITGGATSITTVASEDTDRFSSKLFLTYNSLNTISVTAKDSAQNESKATILHITHDNIVPLISIVSPKDGVTLPEQPVKVIGQVQDVGGIASLALNDYPLTPETDGSFETDLALTEGENLINLVAYDLAGNEGTNTISVMFVQEVVDTSPPLVMIESPPKGSLINTEEISVFGSIVDASDIDEVIVFLNEVSLPEIDLTDGHFEFMLTLPAEGIHTILVTAKDAVQLQGSDSITLTLDQTPPSTPTLDVINPPSPTNKMEVTFYGTCDPGVVINVSGGSSEVQTLGEENGNYMVKVPLLQNTENTLSLIATDSAGNSCPTSVVATVVQDSQPPAILSIDPVDGAQNILLNKILEVTFSEVMNQEDLADHISLKDAIGNVIPWQIDESAQSSDTAIPLRPAAEWPDDQIITIEINPEATDLAGNSLTAFTSRFETIDRTGPAPPVITSTLTPITNQSVLSVTGTTEENAAVSVYQDESEIAQTTAGEEGAFTLDIPLALNSVNHLSLLATDIQGNQGSANIFAIIQDSLPPSVTITPSEGTEDVPYDNPVICIFNEAMNAATTPAANQSNGTIILTDGSNTLIPGQFFINEAQTEITFMADDLLPDSAQITCTVSTQVLDLAGNPLPEEVVSTFFILDQTPPPPPQIGNVTPSSPTPTEQVQIQGTSEPYASIKALGPGGQAETAADDEGNFTIALTLKSNQKNIIKLTATDQHENEGSPTEAEVIHDSLPPQVNQINPQEQAVDVPTNTHFVLTFSETLDQKTVLGEGFSEPGLLISTKDGAPVNGQITISQSIVTFIPDEALTEGTEYTITVTPQVSDLAGNSLAQSDTRQFKTAGVAPSLVPGTPVISSVEPESPTNQLSVLISGEAEAGVAMNVSGGASPVTGTAKPEGKFSLTVTLQPNHENTLSITAQNQHGTSPAAGLTMVHDNQGPNITISAPKDGDEVPVSTVRVIGKAIDSNEIQSVSVNGQAATLDAGGEFSASVSLVEGNNTITVTSQDILSNDSQVVINVTLNEEDKDTTPPVVTITSPSNNARVAGTTRVQGTVTDASPIKDFTINGYYVPLVGGSFNTLISLSSSDTAITATATDEAGLTGSDSVAVITDSEAPSKPELDPIPEMISDSTTKITGTADPGSIIEIENAGEVYTQVVSEDGTFEVEVDLTTNQDNDLSVSAVDEVGNESETETVSVTQDANPLIITEVYPENNQRQIPLEGLIRVTFSKSVDLDTLITSGHFIVLLNGLTQISGTLSLTPGGLLATFTPSEPWPGNSQITVKCAQGITSIDGFSLLNEFISSFFTMYPPGDIKGVVVDPDMRPLPGITAGISFKDMKTQTDSTGNFILQNVPAGITDVLIDGLSADDSRRFGSATIRVYVPEGEVCRITKPIILTPINQESKTIITDDTTSIDFYNTIPKFVLTISPNSTTFPDGRTYGEITATLVDITAMPVQLPDNIIPSILVMLEPSGVSINPPALLAFPNISNLAPYEEVDVFCLHGAHNFEIIGSGKVNESGDLIETEICLSHFSYVGYYEQRATGVENRYLQGRVIDQNGEGIGHVPVSIPFSNANILTRDDGSYLIPLPQGVLPFLRVLAAVSTTSNSREASTLVYQSEPVEPLPIGATSVPDIIVDAFVISGNIRLVNANGDMVVNADITVFDSAGNLTSLSPEDFAQIKIMVLRETGQGEFASTPVVSVSPMISLDDPYYNGYFQEVIFNGPKGIIIPGERSPVRIAQGELLRFIGYSPKAGYIGINEVKVPESIDIESDLILHYPEVTLKVERLFYANNIRQRRIIPHGGSALITDQLILISTIWGTEGKALPALPPSITLYGQLITTAVTGGERDIRFTIPPGESARVLEIRGSFPDSLAVIDVINSAGKETIDIASERSFAPQSILPLGIAGPTGDYQGNIKAFNFTVSSDTEIQAINTFGIGLGAPIDGISTVFGRSGSVEGGSTVTITNLTTGASITLTANQDGSFDGDISASVGDIIQTVSQDDSGNISDPIVAEVLNIPQITEIIPTQANRGETITIKGSGFSPLREENDVRFSGITGETALAKVLTACETVLTITVPFDAADGPVTNTVKGETSNGYVFTVTNPSIYSIDPQSGVPGDHLTVTILGQHTRFNKNTTAVDFGPFITIESLALTSQSQLTANITIRDDATFGLQKVKVVCRDNTLYSPRGFVILYPLQPSSITTIEPEQGIPGYPVTIHGSGFRPSIFDNHVYFNNLRANVIDADTTYITATIPADFRGGTVSVKIGNVFSNPLEYTVSYAGVIEEITYGATVSGEIVVKGVDDKYLFNGTKGDRLSITLDRVADLPDGTGGLNPAVILLNQHGESIAYDDNSGSDSPSVPGANAYLDTIILPEDGGYTIVVVGEGAIDLKDISVESAISDSNGGIGFDLGNLYTTGHYSLNLSLH